MPHKKDNLATVRVHKDLAETIDQIINSDIGKKYGFRSRADFVTKALREYLDKVYPRFKHLNMVGDNVKVVDFATKKIATIYFRNGGIVHCDSCDSADCEHIDFALEQSDVREALEKADWKKKQEIAESEPHLGIR